MLVGYLRMQKGLFKFHSMIPNSYFWYLTFFFTKKVKCRLIQMVKKPPRKRVKIKSHYYRVRQRSTKKGKKGTIMGKWKQ